MANIGLLGELMVEQRLVEQGWHPVRLDTAQMAANADLLAINRTKRVSIQVKTTKGWGHSHEHWLGFGYATHYLDGKGPVFNAKESPIIADAVVAVSYRPEGSRFVVMPVAFIENLCRVHADYWYSVPKREGQRRSSSFTLYLCFDRTPATHTEHHARVMHQLLEYEEKWDVLDLEPEHLRDLDAWPVMK